MEVRPGDPGYQPGMNRTVDLDNAWRRAQTQRPQMPTGGMQPPPANWSTPPPGFSRWQPQQNPTDVQLPQRTMPTGGVDQTQQQFHEWNPQQAQYQKQMQDMEQRMRAAQQAYPIQEPMGQFTGGSVGGQMQGGGGSTAGGQMTGARDQFQMDEQATAEMARKKHAMAGGAPNYGQTSGGAQLEHMGGGQDRPAPFGGGGPPFGQHMGGNPFAGNPFGAPEAPPAKPPARRKPAAKKSAPKAKASAKSDGKAASKAPARAKPAARKAPPFGRKK